MNAPIEALYQVGQNLYAVLISPVDGKVWNQNTQLWEAYNSGHWSQYAVTMTEYSGSGYYRAAYPIASPTLLSSDLIFVRSGGSPALGDSPVTSILQSQGVNVGAASNSWQAGQNFGTSTGTMQIGAAVTGTLSPSVFTTDLTSSINAAYQGRVVIFTSGVLIEQAGNIIAYDGTTKSITVGGPFTQAPANLDAFIIV